MICELVVAPDEVSNLDELMMSQGDMFYIDQILDLAKCLDETVKRTADLHLIIVEHGYTIMRSGHRFLAVREAVEECVRCHQRLPQMDGIAI